MAVKVIIENSDPFVRKVELYDRNHPMQALMFQVGPFDSLTIPFVFGEFKIVVRDIE